MIYQFPFGIELIISKWMGMESCYVSICIAGIIVSNELFFSGNKYPESSLFVCIACFHVHCCVFASESHMNTNTFVKGQ